MKLNTTSMSSSSPLDFGGPSPSTPPGPDSVELDPSFSPNLGVGQSCDGAGPPRKIFSCKRCPYSTDRKNNLKRHMVAMHEVTVQRLECCGLRFLSKADLKVHNNRFHSEGYKCPVCGQHFVRKALLERHFSVHTGEKRFACDCGYRTSHKSNLERHYKTHLKDSSCLSSHQQGRTDVAVGTSFKLSPREKFSLPGVQRDPANLSFSRSMMMMMKIPSVSLPNTASHSPPPPTPLRRFPSYPPIPIPIHPGTSRSSGLGLPFHLKTPSKESESCSKVKPNILKRGFTVEEILNSDTESKPLSLNSYNAPRRPDSQSTSPIQPMIQIHNSGMANLSRPYMERSSSTISLKSPKVLKPFPLYRGFPPLSSTSLTTYPSTSFSLSTTSSSLVSQPLLPSFPSSMAMPTSSTGLSSTSSLMLSPSLHYSTSTLAIASSSQVPKQTNQPSSARSSFFIGDILKGADYVDDTRKFTHCSKDKMGSGNFRNLTHRTDEVYRTNGYAEHRNETDEQISDDEHWHREERTEEQWNIGKDFVKCQEKQVLEQQGEIEKREEIFYQEHKLEQRKKEQSRAENEHELEQERKYYKQHILNGNSKSHIENEKLFLLRKFPLSGHLPDQSLENKISDFTHYIHKKWRVKNSL